MSERLMLLTLEEAPQLSSSIHRGSLATFYANRQIGYNQWVKWINLVWQNWLGVLQTVGVAGALLFTGFALLLDARSRRAGNLIRLTDRHRDLWERMYTEPHLSRILDPNADLTKRPVTPEEEMFTIFIILHLSDNYFVIKAGFFPKPRGLRKDIRSFLSLPIPSSVWRKVRDLQDDPFAEFVEKCWPESRGFHS